MTTSSTTQARRDRPLDLVLYGATGFTGQLVADHLAEVTSAPPGQGKDTGTGTGGAPFRWALAGRDRRKLEVLAAQLQQAHPQAAVPELIVADAQARAELDALAARTRVVCTTAGPFSRYGSQLVAACAAAGTDYCDITGEVHWVREMIDAHHQQAVATGARLVHFCGFDSIPSDLGTWALQQEMIARHGGPASQVTTYVERLKGSMSGGTIASILEVAKAISADRGVARKLAAPYGLNPDPAYRGADGRDARGLGYDREVGLITMPFLMASANTRVVRRAHALAGFPWGEDFRYTELATAKPLAERRAAGGADDRWPGRRPGRRLPAASSLAAREAPAQAGRRSVGGRAPGRRLPHAPGRPPRRAPPELPGRRPARPRLRLYLQDARPVGAVPGLRRPRHRRGGGRLAHPLDRPGRRPRPPPARRRHDLRGRRRVKGASPKAPC
jgi:short subunit dehydrogenase-like uncharacterized protein